MPSDWKVVVVGASAGGVEALMNLVSSLPGDLDAPVFVCLHVNASTRSALPQILTRLNRLPATYPLPGQKVQPGKIYVAPPDQHMLLRNGIIELSRGPRENNSRPAIDPLFRSAAVNYGERVIGVLLSGMLDDGSYGLRAIKRAGGSVLIQDPADALFPDMPSAARRLTAPDFTGTAADIGEKITELVLSPNGSIRQTTNKADVIESNIAELRGRPESTKELGNPSAFACPACFGVLWELKDEGEPRYRCRVGHSYTANTLIDSQGAVIESALWSAVRALQERADLLNRIASRIPGTTSARRFIDDSRESLEQAQAIIALISRQERPLVNQEPSTEPSPSDQEQREAG